MGPGAAAAGDFVMPANLSEADVPRSLDLTSIWCSLVVGVDHYRPDNENGRISVDFEIGA